MELLIISVDAKVKQKLVIQLVINSFIFLIHIFFPARVLDLGDCFYILTKLRPLAAGLLGPIGKHQLKKQNTHGHNIKFRKQLKMLYYDELSMALIAHQQTFHNNFFLLITQRILAQRKLPLPCGQHA